MRREDTIFSITFEQGSSVVTWQDEINWQIKEVAEARAEHGQVLDEVVSIQFVRLPQSTIMTAFIHARFSDAS